MAKPRRQRSLEFATEPRNPGYLREMRETLGLSGPPLEAGAATPNTGDTGTAKETRESLRGEIERAHRAIVDLARSQAQAELAAQEARAQALAADPGETRGANTVALGGRVSEEEAAAMRAVVEPAGWNLSTFAALSARAMFSLITEAPIPTVPAVVKLLRTLRGSNAMLDAPRDPFATPPPETARYQRWFDPSPPLERDRPEVSDLVGLPMYGQVPAGDPLAQDGNATDPESFLYVPTHRARGVDFVLRVRGTSMDQAQGEQGPIYDGNFVGLARPERREPRDGDIVAALLDREVTLKRLHCARPRGGKGPRCVLRAESSDPAYQGKEYRAVDGVVQGVLVWKL